MSIYQSHHLWNWNPQNWKRAGSGWRLSIAPSLELKQIYVIINCNFTIFYQSHHLWNWNSKELRRLMEEEYYQSHHLWNWNSWVNCTVSISACTINRTISGIETQNLCLFRVEGSYYQSHHLWNWNKLALDKRAGLLYLSIAPSLELKLSTSSISFWNFGLYQSHHLWNWNIINLAKTLKQYYTINRTISGIETS